MLIAFFSWLYSRWKLYREVIKAGFSSWRNFCLLLLGIFSSELRIAGTVRCVIRDQFGNLKLDSVSPNLVVTTGRQHIADQLSDQNEAALGYMAVGTSSQAVAAGDTTLIAEVARVALDSKTQGTGDDAHKVFYEATFPAGTATAVLTEAGMFNMPTGGVMFCRSTFGGKDKEATDVMTLYWTIIITA